jgi:hypothetical protein
LNSCLKIHFLRFTDPPSEEDEEDFSPFDEELRSFSYLYSYNWLFMHECG